ncbi:MAG: hypothetical protein Alpg2KO_05480 [Alphaproteobacteria bacterium]
MRINGVDHSDSDPDDLLDAMSKVTRGFDRDSRPATDPKPLTRIPAPAAIAFNQALDAAEASGETADLACAYRQADLLASKAAKLGKTNVQAQALALKCETANRALQNGHGDPDLSRSALIDGYQTGREVMKAELPPARFGRIAGGALRQMGMAASQDSLPDVHPGWSTSTLDHLGNDAGKDAATSWQAMQGQPDPDAQYVCQGEIGYSSDTRLSTDTVLNCVAVGLRNPQTGKTALTHIDHFNSMEPLDPALIDRLGQPEDGQPLQAMLLGAQDGNSDMARQNLTAVRDWLGSRDVDVVFAQMNDPEQPAALCIDPKSGEISTDTAPMSERDLNSGVKMGMREGPTPMHVAFDLDQDDGPGPIAYTDAQAAKLRDMPKGDSITGTARWFDQSYPGMAQRNDHMWAGAVNLLNTGAAEFQTRPEANPPAMTKDQTAPERPTPATSPRLD